MLPYIQIATNIIQHEESAILMTTNHSRTEADEPPEALCMLYRNILQTTDSVCYNSDVITIQLTETVID
jgi:hypothetical protein